MAAFDRVSMSDSPPLICRRHPNTRPLHSRITILHYIRYWFPYGFSLTERSFTRDPAYISGPSRRAYRWTLLIWSPVLFISFQTFSVVYHMLLNVDEIHHRLGKQDPADDPEPDALPDIKTLNLTGTVQDKRSPREESLALGLVQAISRGQCPNLKEVKWGRRTSNSVQCLCPFHPFPSLWRHTI